ncbi:MAG: hypothetical protein Q8K60_05970 [Parachlamydiaceae bacterium]|nr:hypothetical protein [Parachlamydiaceae bacterium]
MVAHSILIEQGIYLRAKKIILEADEVTSLGSLYHNNLEIRSKKSHIYLEYPWKNYTYKLLNVKYMEFLEKIGIERFFVSKH